MTTVVLTPTLTGQDGLSCLAAQFVSALTEIDGDRVEVVSLAGASDSVARRPPHVTVTDCKGSRTEFVRRAWLAARQSTPPSRVVVMHAHLLPAAWPLVRRGAALVPVLVGVEAWRPLRWARRRVLSQARRAIAISHHTAREFRRANPRFAALPIDVCWPATPPLSSPDDVAASERGRFALIVGRLSAEERYKGHDLLIDVWPEVQRRSPAARLVVAGTGDDEARLRDRASAAGLSEAIDFVGSQPPARLAALYRDCAFLVLPSRREGFGFVFLEAMSAGRACIGGRGAAEEIILHGETGLIVDSDQPDDVRNAIVTLFSDESLCARLGERGRNRARVLFSHARFTKELAEHLTGFLPHAMSAAC